MENNLLNTILKNTYTLSQFKKRVKTLHTSLSNQFFQSLEQTTINIEEADWLKNLPKEFLGQFNKDNLSTLIASLNSQIIKMQILTLYLPFKAEGDLLNQIGQKVRSIFGANFLIDIRYNPVLIAGCAMSWKGIYKDYSLHQKIAERRLPILQSFKKFLQ